MKASSDISYLFVRYHEEPSQIIERVKKPENIDDFIEARYFSTSE